MNLQNFKVKREIDKIIKGINRSETIFFCGAGISFNSGIPLVRHFVLYFLLSLCASREEIQKIEDSAQNSDIELSNIIEIASKIFNAPEEVVLKIINTIPFEAFIEAIQNVCSVDKILEIYDASTYSPSLEPTTIHLFIAKLAAIDKLHTIVTTNFDQLIEKALENVGKIEGKDFDVVCKEEDFYKIDWEKKQIRLIKIHGSVNNKQSMAITLSQVAKKELSEMRAKILDHVFSKGSHKNVLLLGYSCSDVFDISPHIEKINKNQKKVTLVQHDDSQRIEDIRLQKEKNPFLEYKKGTRLYFDTDKLIGSLWGSVIKSDYNRKKNQANWKNKVDHWISTSGSLDIDVVKRSIFGSLVNRISGRIDSLKYFEQVHNIMCPKSINLKKSGGTIRDFMEIGLERKSLMELGSSYLEKGEYQKAIEYYEQELISHKDYDDKIGEASCLANIGIAYNGYGEYVKAFDYCRQALKIATHVGDKSNEGGCLGDLGTIYFNLGQYSKALGYYEQALNIAQNTGNKYAEPIWLSNLGMLNFKLGKIITGTIYFTKALDIYRKLSPNHPNIRKIERNLSTEVKSIVEPPKLDTDLIQALYNQGLSLCDLKQYNEGLVAFDKVIELNPRLKDVWYNKGVTLAYLSRHNEALVAFEKAIEFGLEGDSAWHNKGVVLKAMDRIEEAEKCFQIADELISV